MPAAALALGLAAALVPAPGRAQGVRASVGAQAVPAWFHADPIPGGGTRSEIKLVQPIVMAHLSASRFTLLGTLDLEGLTMPGGELAPGDWGEGFVDRRHPHTYVHELVLSGSDLLRGLDGPAELSLTVGKGFAPFGTDDPMTRPFVRFPVNHHLAQILERAVGIAAYRAGPVTAEAALFNGDEPERPGQWPRIGHRFGDSWSGRLTVRPLGGVELQGSIARVSSPEHRPGAGTEQRKSSLSTRLDRRVGTLPVYGLVEWERTTEAGGAFRFHSILMEAQARPGAHRVAYRFERTTRPEEDRTVDPFRAERPHLENSIIGVTRWTVHTLAYAYALPPIRRAVAVTPFAELSAGRIDRVSGVVFDPAAFYGRTHFWTLTAGARLALGGGTHRMGRYGAAASDGPATDAMMAHMHEEEM